MTASDGDSHPPVDDEVAQVRLFLFAHRRLERNRLLRDAQHLADLAHRQFHAPGQFLGGRLAAQFLLQQALRRAPAC